MPHQWDPRSARCVVCQITDFDIAYANHDPGCHDHSRSLPSDNRCETCGREIHIGDWPFCPHGTANPSKGFAPYFDVGLGREVTGWGDVRQAMRENHLDFRDHPNQERTEQYFERARLAREGRL